MAMNPIKATVICISYLFMCQLYCHNHTTDTCYVQSNSKWIHYSDAKVSEISSKQFSSSNEIKVESFAFNYYYALSYNVHVGKCLSCYLYITNDDCKSNLIMHFLLILLYGVNSHF